MRKLSIRFIIALLTFVLGIAATTMWFLNRQSANQQVRLIIPNASWEPIFFRQINAVANFAELTNLRQSSLTEGDLEVRVWWGFGLEPLEGVTLKRVAGQWSAIHLQGDNYYEPQKAERIELRAPKSGWDTCWQRLVNAGILVLPDASQVQCNVGGLDGMSYVVEVNTNNTYRTYMYDNPYYARCNEARQMIEIGNLIADEFDVEEFRTRE